MTSRENDLLSDQSTVQIWRESNVTRIFCHALNKVSLRYIDQKAGCVLVYQFTRAAAIGQTIHNS